MHFSFLFFRCLVNIYKKNVHWYDYTFGIRRELLLTSNLLFRTWYVCNRGTHTQSITAIKWEGKIYANYSFFLVSLLLLCYYIYSVQILCKHYSDLSFPAIHPTWERRKKEKYLCTNIRMYLKVFYCYILVKVMMQTSGSQY